jgi:sugar lactone lactonase YvrE
MRRSLVIVALSLLAPLALAQSILTIAGGGSDDGQLATAIPTRGPRGLLTDKSGNLYYVETSGRVRRVDAATKRVTVIAGNGGAGFAGDGGPANAATLNTPVNIAFDGDGNLFIVDRDNNRIRRVDAKTGIITTFAGGAQLPDGEIGDGLVATSAQLFSPYGIVISGGYLWFSESAYNGNRIRRINMETKIVQTAAGPADGKSGFADGPSSQALFNTPISMAADSDGNIYVADLVNFRIRRIDKNLNVTTYAGNGTQGSSGDGGQATAAQLDNPLSLAFDAAGNLTIGLTDRVRIVNKTSGVITLLSAPFGQVLGLAYDPAGNLFVEDDSNGVIEKLTISTGEVTLYAGGGDFIGDGRVATAAILSRPLGLALNKKGDLFIADSSNTVVRKIDAATGTIRTVAGMVSRYYTDEQEGIDATDAAIGGVLDVALDSHENLYTADPHNGRIWKVDANGKISTYAKLDNLNPWALAFDANDNLFIADRDGNVVRRVDAATKALTIVAGNGTAGRSGDDGLATAAMLNQPAGLAIDADGNLFISDTTNAVIRRVEAHTQIITTYAGGASPQDGIGDNGPALQASLTPVHLAINKSNGDLYAADQSLHRIRRIDGRTHTITTVAGSANFYLFGDFGGDNGPATSAKLNLGYEISGVALSSGGDLFLSDSVNNRVRAVYACRSLDPTVLTSPADGASRSPSLAWRSVPGAFRYDVYLDTANPPVKIAAADLAETSFTPGNLAPSTRYYWRVVSKGDPFCSQRSTSSSTTATFTTAGGCALGAFDTTSPADNANVQSPLTLSWQALTGAATYDVYLGPSNPPALFASGITGTSLQVTPRGTLFWFVVAHAACDAQITSTTPVHSFTVGQGCQQGSVTVAIASPANGATDVPSPVTLEWTSTNANGFNVDFGTTTPPPTFAAGLSTNHLAISDLKPGTTYFWRVTATGCDPNPQTPIVSFTTRTCAVPGAPSFTFTPPSVTSGSTYTIVWSAAQGIDAGGGYLVERSTSATFVTILDAQVTQSRAAAFVAGAPGTLYHRVRAVPACDPTKPGPVSDVRSVPVTEAPPNVVFTVQPAAAISPIGQRIDSLTGSFTLENLASTPLQVIVGRQELGGAPPFFSIVDPSGTDAAFVTLQPHTPHTFQIRYAGPRNDLAASYEGVIFAAATGKPLAVTPYAFVNLRVGGSGTSAPQFRIGGSPSDYAAFAPFAANGDDTARAPLSVTIANTGSAPMELASEIGPEVWLAPESGWNATPIAPNSSRTVTLNTRRSRAPGGSALPRYTYFTVRTKDGGSARLLVQDNDTLSVANGRSSRLDSSDSTLLVPEVVSRVSGSGTLVVSRMWITNIGGEAVQVELTYTPQNADGFDASQVRRAIVVVPPNDVATITDPLAQIFNATRPARGSIEVRLPRERLGFVSVSASIVAIGAGTSYTMPVVGRGDGARAGSPQTLLGIMKNPGATTALTLVETSGVDSAQVTAKVFAANGTQLGTVNASVPRYGFVRFDDLAASVNAASIDGGRVEVSVANGSGASVAALGTISDVSGERGAVSLAASFTQAPGATSLARRMIAPDDTATLVTTIVPVPTTTTKTEVVFSAPSGLSSTFSALFRLASGVQNGDTKSFTVPGGVSIVFHDVLANLFNLGSAVPGSMSVSSSNGGRVTAVLEKSNPTSSAPSSSLPLPTTASDLLTGATLLSQRPLFYDGLEQSTDATVGARWMLVLNEVGGASGSVTVRLYEAGNRTTPVAQQDFTIAPYQQLTLDTVFAALGLDTPERRKDRTNVQVVVIATTGSARVAATALAVDNHTGDTQAHALTPGSALPSVSIVTPILPTSQTPTRRRAAGR